MFFSLAYAPNPLPSVEYTAGKGAKIKERGFGRAKHVQTPSL